MNLVCGSGNKNEVMLKNRYEEMLTLCKGQLDYVTYKFFDFHHECHVDSAPMSNLVNNFVYPNNLVNTGIFCEDYRLIQENN